MTALIICFSITLFCAYNRKFVDGMFYLPETGFFLTLTFSNFFLKPGYNELNIARYLKDFLLNFNNN